MKKWSGAVAKAHGGLHTDFKLSPKNDIPVIPTIQTCARVERGAGGLSARLGSCVSELVVDYEAICILIGPFSCFTF